MTVLVTGAAGFIGYHVAKRLLSAEQRIVAVDSLNAYYDVGLKRARLRNLEAYPNFTFHKMDIADAAALQRVFEQYRPGCVIHLAAQAGVRYSIESPDAYVTSNLVGFGNILEACRHFGVGHLVFASTSSVYGANVTVPFSEHHLTDHPVSFYAATKKANEVMAHSYAWLYGLPCTGLRFFTVYGPWGRPDMALFRFTDAILSDDPIDVYNNGDMVRDFTYIDDIVEGVIRILEVPPRGDAMWRAEDPDPATSSACFRVFNLGHGKPVPLMSYIEVLERSLGKKAKVRFLPMQPGDVYKTYADTTELRVAVGYEPVTSVEDGVKQFVDWYRDYYKRQAAF
ncbi:MAG: NAD-dependent epimerase [Betaproteobacteria bacterium]|nr:MAG: NAD-dependent epimerase [Betaproteobacteria bacterium]